MKITVKIVSQYGTQRVLPVCDNAKLFAAIAGTATLTESTIRAIKSLGYAIEVAQDITCL